MGYNVRLEANAHAVWGPLAPIRAEPRRAQNRLWLGCQKHYESVIYVLGLLGSSAVGTACKAWRVQALGSENSEVTVLELGVPLVTMIAANAIMSLASALQASVGIGLALLAVPLLALVEPRLVPGPMLLAGSLLALASAYRERHAVDAQSFGLSLLGLATGTVFGAVALSTIRTEHLSKVFAILVLLAVALSVSGLRVRPTRAALFAGGGAAGVMGTMVGIHGPPMALVLQHARPEHARAMLGAFFFVAYVGSIAALAACGLFGMLQLKLAAGLLPGVVAGLLVAPLLAGFFSPARLRVAILSISASSAVVLLWR